MTDIDPARLDELLIDTAYTSLCLVLDSETRSRELRFSYTPLRVCERGQGSPEVRGFKNGHYRGILLMPKDQEDKVYFLIRKGELNYAIKDSKTILSLINSNALFPEKRPSQIILEDKLN